jgi:hypothetical protein
MGENEPRPTQRRPRKRTDTDDALKKELTLTTSLWTQFEKGQLTLAPY